MVELPQRKEIRLKGYNYSQNGAYFITICSNNRMNLFGDVMCTLKSITTKRVNKICNVSERKIWQYRFYDHIVRNEQEYQKIWGYIQTNPLNWENDKFYYE